MAYSLTTMTVTSSINCYLTVQCYSRSYGVVDFITGVSDNIITICDLLVILLLVLLLDTLFSDMMVMRVGTNL